MNKLAKFFRDYSVARFFIPLGIILIVFGYFMFVSIDNTKDYIETNAVVSRTVLYEDAYYDGDVHHDATYTVYVRYTVDGVLYDEEFGIFSGYKEGDNVTITYNPENPEEIASPTSIFFPIGFVIAGIISIVISIFSILKTNKKNKELKKQEEEWHNGN